MKTINIRCAAASLLAGIMILTTGEATTVIPMSDEEMVRDAGIILTGTITGLSSEWTLDHGQIHTVVTISVDSFLKGALPERILALRILGGTVQDTTLLIVDSPSFTTGQEVILLLRPDYTSLFPIVGFNQGKFTVALDPTTGQRTVRERQISVADFISNIIRLIDEQR